MMIMMLLFLLLFFFLFTSALRLCFPSALRTVFVVCVACVATCSDI